MKALAVLLVLVSGQTARDEVKGFRWTKPGAWHEAPARSIRVATYTVPRAAGDAEPPECAVFMFKPGLGGSVEQTLDLWVGVFEDPDLSAPEQTRTGGRTTTLVEVDGTLRDGPDGAYKLLGAIVETSHGRMFFRLVGPARSVDAAHAAFTGMVRGVKS